MKRLYHVGHDTYYKQMLVSTKTSPQRAKRQEVTYVRAAPRWKPIRLSLLLNQGLVFSPTSLNIIAFDPPPFQKPIQQKTKQMQRRVVVPANDDCRVKTTQSMCNHGTGSYGGQHRVHEFLLKSTGVPLELPLQIRTPNLHRHSDKNSSSANGGNFKWCASTYCSHCSTGGNEDPCLIFWRRQ